MMRIILLQLHNLINFNLRLVKSYRMHIEKTSIKWHDNDTVEYVQPQTFVFNRDASVGPDDENFTTINIPYIVRTL